MLFYQLETLITPGYRLLIQGRMMWGLLNSQQEHKICINSAPSRNWLSIRNEKLISSSTQDSKWWINRAVAWGIHGYILFLVWELPNFESEVGRKKPWLYSDFSRYPYLGTHQPQTEHCLLTATEMNKWCPKRSWNMRWVGFCINKH